MKFEIKYRWSGEVKLTIEGETRNAAIKQAIIDKKDLSGSNLSGSNLSGSDLSGSNLSGSNLSGSDLSGSNLSGSNLSGSNLSGSNLSGSNLSGSDLSGSDLSGSNLQPIRDDLWAVLSASPAEVEGLRKALIEGRVNGSTYEGDCACLVGTIANVKKCDYKSLEILKPISERPAEKFFLGINQGDTPENNQFAALAVEWIDIWLANIKAAFCGK